MKPITKISLAAILLASVFVVGCGSSSCDKNLPLGAAGACTTSSSSSSSGSGSGSGSGTGSGTGTTANPGPFTIGGNVVGLTGTGLVLQDNGGNSLTLSQNGAFVFTTPIALGSAYAVTVATQPSGQTLPCSVTSGAGTATANVTNVQITCGNTYSVGGVVSGLQGSGLVLQDNGGNNLTVSGTGNPSFTFPVPLPAGSTYAVTILTQPSAPGQTCSVANGSGTLTSNINTVQIVCPEAGFTVGGSIVGLVDGAGDTVELLNNGGDNLFATGNNTNFIFPTLVTAGGGYDVFLFTQPTSQPQSCVLFNYRGVVNADIANVLVDCQHNDWTWVDAPNTAGAYGTATLPPPLPPAQDPNAPGGRDFAATWTDSTGRKWLFGGFGLDLPGATPPNLPGLLNDLWLWSPDVAGGWIPAALPIISTTPGGVPTNTANLVPDETTDNPGGTTPGGRWGSITWSDSSGNLWLFGGEGYSTTGYGLLNDIWKFAPGSYDVTIPAPPATPTQIGSYTYTGNWTAVSNSTTQNNPGTYPATPGTAGGGPGGRWGAAFSTDPAGANVWVFGGQGLDSNGDLALLNDLWKYNIAGQTWTWMGPTNSKVGQNNGSYGTQGTPSAINFPGGRQAAMLWVDNAGNLWLYGGLGLDSAGTRNPGTIAGLAAGSAIPDGALLNDLWKYDIGTGQWTWVSGGGATGLSDQTGVYGTQQVAAAGNIPGSRWGSAGFVDSSNNLFVFGGWGYASNVASSTGYLNDVWEYQQSSGQWIWWKGSSNVNQPGSFPSQYPPSYDVPYVQNTPGSRFGSAYWKQGALDYFHIFGGEGFDVALTPGYLSDLLDFLPFP